MNNLKLKELFKDWDNYQLYEICTISKGIQLNRLELQKDALYPCINGGIEPSGFTNEYNRPRNTITISEGGNSCGYVNYIKTKFWCGGHCYSLLNIKSTIDKLFLFYALKYHQKAIMDLRIGSGLPNIQNKAIKSFCISYPKSFPEQQKIAEILGKVDKAIEQTEALINKYKRIKSGLMQDLLTKGIDEHRNIRNEDTHEFKDSPLGRIPKEWACVPTEALCLEIVVGIVIKPTQYYVENGIPMLRSMNVKEGKILLENLVYMSPEDNDRLEKSKLKISDVVSVRTGNPGTSSAINSKVAGCNCIDLVITRTNPHKLNHNFLVLWLNSYIAKKQIFNTQTGIAQQHFNVGDMKKLIIFKISLDEQERIINATNANQKAIDSSEQQLNKLKKLKTGLMQDLLSGKVRVTSLLREKA